MLREAVTGVRVSEKERGKARGRGSRQEQEEQPPSRRGIADLSAGSVWSVSGPGACRWVPGRLHLKWAALSFADKMHRLCVYALILAMALATFSEASWKPHYKLQDSPSDPGVNRGLEPHWLDRLGPAPHHRRQIGRQGPPHLVAGRSY